MKWGRGTELAQLVLGKHLLGGQLMMVTWAPRALERGRGKITQDLLGEREKRIVEVSGRSADRPLISPSRMTLSTM